MVHIRPVTILRTFSYSFLDETANLDCLQRDKPIEVCLRRLTDVVSDRAFQIAFRGFEFSFDSGIQCSSSVAFFCGEVGEILQRKTLVLVNAVLFELSAKLVGECVASTKNRASDG
jgi:hypothetical protein